MLADASAGPVLPARPPTDPTADERVYVPATGDARVLEFEERLGSRLPLSLRAWYEVIDTVSLMGAHPRLNPSEKPQRPAMYVNPALFSLPGGSERLAEQRKKMARLGMDLTTELPNANPEPLADPLVIFPLDALEDCMEDQDEEICNLPIAPDELHKANISGDAYYIRLPHAGADLPFDDWHKTTFTGYLREVFRWGGFPGWSRSKRPPVEELEFLTRSLLPL
jgi:hypothetical protein